MNTPIFKPRWLIIQERNRPPRRPVLVENATPTEITVTLKDLYKGLMSSYHQLFSAIARAGDTEGFEHLSHQFQSLGKAILTGNEKKIRQAIELDNEIGRLVPHAAQMLKDRIPFHLRIVSDNPGVTFDITIPSRNISR